MESVNQSFRPNLTLRSESQTVIAILLISNNIVWRERQSYFSSADTVMCQTITSFGVRVNRIIICVWSIVTLFGVRPFCAAFGTEVPFPKPVDGFGAQVLEMHIRADGRQVWSV